MEWPADAHDAAPKLSDDGGVIAYVAASSDGHEVFTVPTAGGTPTRVTYGPGAVKLEGWTRDGNGLLVVVADAAGSPNGEPTLATIAVRGGGKGGPGGDADLGELKTLPFARAHGGTEDQMGCPSSTR